MSAPVQVANGGVGFSGETLLFGSTQPGIYQCYLDLSAMTGGDVVVVRAYVEINGAGISPVEERTFSGAQTPPFISMGPYSTASYTGNAVKFTAERTSGAVGSVTYTVNAF